jgi:hypothetical protein
VDSITTIAHACCRARSGGGAPKRTSRSSVPGTSPPSVAAIHHAHRVVDAHGTRHAGQQRKCNDSADGLHGGDCRDPRSEARGTAQRAPASGAPTRTVQTCERAPRVTASARPDRARRLRHSIRGSPSCFRGKMTSGVRWPKCNSRCRSAARGVFARGYQPLWASTPICRA